MKIIMYSKDNLFDNEAMDRMFELLEMNMSKIAPIDKERDEIYKEWRESLDKYLDAGTKHILIMEHHLLRGYLSFTVRYTNNDVYLNEIQINPRFQRDGVTVGKLFYSFLSEVKEYCGWNIRTYVNHHNVNSINLTKKIGFKLETSTDRGSTYIISVKSLQAKLSYLLKRYI